MKAILSITWMVLLVGYSLSVNAQSTLFKPFKVDIGLVGAISLDDEAGKWPRLLCGAKIPGQ